MSGFNIATILDKEDRTLSKPFNIRPGYDMKYVVSYIGNYFAFDGKRYDELFDNERSFDTLSIIKQNETPVQWAIRVRIPLQDLLNSGKFSVYHQLCLFASFGKGKFNNFNYYRPRIHKSHMAICFGCWKLIKIDDVQPKKTFHVTRQRYVDYLEPKDLMQEHWDHECDKPKSRDGHARIIQRAWIRFQEKEPTNARLAWNSLPNDNTPDDKKFLTLIPHKIKNPVSLDQIKIRLNKEYAEYIKKYNRYPGNAEFEISWYREYIIPNYWIDSKKRQLRSRFQKRLLEIEA